MHGPFAEHALAYRRAGLPVFPCGGEAGKQPLIRYRHLTEKLPPIVAVERWANREPDANIGLATGPASGVTVVDVDEPSRTSALLAMCGDTPLIAKTPSGGNHLYYKFAGEGCPVRFTKGADLRGRGGIIILPPSRNPTNGEQYRFIRGGIDDFSRLPRAKPGSLPVGRDSKTVASADMQVVHRESRAVQQGTRNDTLFKRALREVRYGDTEDDLVDALRTINEGYLSPLPDGEVVKIANNVWDIEERGDNWVGQEARAVMLSSELDRLNPDAVYLLARLRAAHAARRGSFALSVMYARTLRWTRRRYYNSRDELTKAGLIYCVHQGGSGPGDPPVYRLS